MDLADDSSQQETQSPSGAWRQTGFESFGAMGFVTGNDTADVCKPENEEPLREISHEEASGSDSWARRDSNARPLAPEASALSS
jgi:hypothetical protein